ncbi:MAG: hypothetical protein BWY91_02947 [bacterium ADurb.BinA028]|nr:MAG: hypothetical protein BWY91_02947 [bacterium ADurb.BinA028]
MVRRARAQCRGRGHLGRVAPPRRGGLRPAAAPAGPDRLPLLAAVGPRRAVGGGPGQRAAGGNGTGDHPRPRRGRAPSRRRCLGAARRPRPERRSRRTAGHVQPAGPELVTAAVASAAAGRGGLRALPGHAAHDPAARRGDPCRPCPWAVPALVGSAGAASRPGDLRLLRPRGPRRHPLPGGATRRRRRHRGGPGHLRAVGARLPRGARPARHVDPVVRVCRRQGAVGPRGLSARVPRIGQHP